MKRASYALLGAILAVNAAACGADTDISATDPEAPASLTATSGPATSGSDQPGQPAGEAAATVRVQGFAYSPASVTVKVGDTVEWIFSDGPIQHDVLGVGDNAPEDFRSPLISEGRWSYTFTEPGEFEYFCSVHPQMLGTVIVEE